MTPLWILLRGYVVIHIAAYIFYCICGSSRAGMSAVGALTALVVIFVGMQCNDRIREYYKNK